MSDQVMLHCVREHGRLRVRITSPGYYNAANCQFPRAARQEGRHFVVPASSVRLCASKSGTYFYRVSQPIRILDESTEDSAESAAPASAESATQSGQTSKRKRSRRSIEKPAKVFDAKDEPECVVCLEASKERICVPCGHYCLCESCMAQLVTPKKCPLCRTPIRTSILPSEL